ncbi:MAG: hypothetical protein R2761_23505 [Acidimicrobiales bacterium]
MRRGLASLIMGLSLLVASASWAGFVMSHTVLDPGRSERLADHLLDDPEVKAAIADRIADALQAQVPKGVAIPRQTLEVAANVALEDPRVEALVRDGIVRAHQNALNGVDEPIALDATVLGEAARTALVSNVAALDAVLPPAPQLAVEIPGTGLSWLGTVKDFVDRFTLLGALVSGAGLLASFIITTRRAAVLRRVSFWGFGASAFWLAVAYGLPGLVGFIAPSAMAIASAVVDVFAGAMIRPALVMAGISAALLVASIVWPARERRRPAAMIDRAGPGGRARAAQPRGRASGRPTPAGADYVIPSAGSSSYPGTSYPGSPSPGRYDQGGAPAYADPRYGSPAAASASAGADPWGATGAGSPGFAPAPDPTMQYPVISSSAGTAGGPAPEPVFGQEQHTTPLWPADAGTAPAGPAAAPIVDTSGGGVWVEGVGYIDPNAPAGDPYGATELAPEPYRGATPGPGTNPSEDPTLTAAPLADRNPPR